MYPNSKERFCMKQSIRKSKIMFSPLLIVIYLPLLKRDGGKMKERRKKIFFKFLISFFLFIPLVPVSDCEKTCGHHLHNPDPEVLVPHRVDPDEGAAELHQQLRVAQVHQKLQQSSIHFNSGVYIVPYKLISFPIPNF